MWLILPFVIGAARGVYSPEGKDRLAAGRIALNLCGAAASLPSPVTIETCPADAPVGGVLAFVARSKALAAEIADGGVRDRMKKAIGEFEPIAKGAAPDPLALKRIAEVIGDYLQ
jgi:hypothetical protein